MSPRLAELLAALPEEESLELVRGIPSPTEITAAELSGVWTQPLPVHPLRRLWAMGGLQAQIVFAYVAYWFRSFLGDTEARQKQLAEANLRVALRTLRSMVYLRGAVMKIGQSLANFPDIVPNQFVETLDCLHFDAPPMHFALLREQVRDEFGKDPEDIFDEFEARAFAAASLGQVHRARTRAGERVAVKIQYPAIAQTIEADLRNLNALLFSLRLSPDWEYVRRQFEAVRRMLEQETDYGREAEFQRRAGSLFQSEDGIVIPRVLPEYSTARVLTMELLEGLNIHEFLATRPSQEARDAAGEKMYRAAWRLYYAGLNYADPHPGNYVFLLDGRLGLLDFGCVQAYSQEEIELLRVAEVAADGTPPPFRELARRLGNLTEKELASADLMGPMEELYHWILEPMKRPGPFDFSHEGHLRRGFGLMSQLVAKRYTRGHPLNLYLHRSFFGLRAMLYRLRARVDVLALRAQESQSGWNQAS